jgi:hypothetical protein
MVAGLSDSQSQDETRQNPEIGLLKDNGGGGTTPTRAMEALICLPPWSWWCRVKRGWLRIWTKGPEALPEVKGLVWFTDGSKMRGWGLESMGSL